MLARNWKRRWLLLCLARHARNVSMVRPVAKPMSAKQDLRVSWKPVNQQDCEWKILYRIEDHIAGKGVIHCSTTIWCTNLFLCLKPWRFPQQKQQWIKNGRNWKRFRRGTWRRSEVKKRWSIKSGRRAQKLVDFASLMDICHLKNAELEAKHQKYKGRAVFPGDIHWTRIISISNDSRQNHGYQNHDRTRRPVVSSNEVCSPPHTILKRRQSRRVINDLDNVDFIPSGKIGEFGSGMWRKSKTNLKWSMKQRTRISMYILRRWWISVIWRMLNWRNHKYKGQVILAGDIVKDDSGSYALFTEQGSSASQIDCGKSHGYQRKVTRMHRTSSWCSTCLHSSKNGRCSKIIESS